MEGIPVGREGLQLFGWCHLQQRKKRLLELMKRMLNYQMENDNASGMRIVTEQDMNELSGLACKQLWFVFRVHGVQTVEGLMDVSTKFQLYYGSELCIQNGLGGLAARFGLTPLQFAENLDWKRHEIEQDDEEPLKAAEQYVCPSFPTPESVLAGAIHIVAKQLSREPKVREMLRRRYRMRLRITVCPTKKGREEIDENHKLWPRRYIRDKPVAQLRHDEFLWYAQAKSAGLLNVKLHCDTDEEVRFKRTLLQEFLTDQPYYKDEYSRVVDLWNKAREEAVIVCVNSFILPVLEREAHGRLLQESRDYQSTQNLYDRIRMAAYRSPHEYGDDSENGFTGGTRVLSIAYPEERGQASFCALLDQDGQVLDHLRLVNITKGLNSRRPGEADLKRQDLNSLRKFIEKRRPHVIAISGENMEAIYLHRDISSM
ncbi:unnamed protein product, partial [Gongylonema pulchrum]|uniref:YqgF domain-containing protein n=1 Tax=Gongylonema pulchrum TaxID=637853 RepID=A0A183CZJ2_9BILA